MKLKQKLLSAFLSVSLLTLGVSYGISLTIQTATIQDFQNVGGKALPGSLALSRMTTQLYQTVVLTMRYAEKGDRNDREKIEKSLATLGTFKTMHTLYHNEDKAWYDQIDESTQRFSSFIAQYILLVNKGEQDKLSEVKQKIDVILHDFTSSINPHIEEELNISRQTLETTIKRINNSKIVLIVSSILLLLTTFVISLFISHRCSKPILQLRDAALKISQGKLDIKIRQESHDEIGELANTFNIMTENLFEAREELCQTNKTLLEEIAERSLTTQALNTSEKNYGEIFNATNEAIFIHDADNGAILEVNKTVLEMYGYGYEEALSLSIADFSINEPPYTHKEATRYVKKAISDGPQVFEWRARRQDGEPFWVEVALSSTKIGGSGKVLAVVRDISNRKKMEGDLLQSQKMKAVGVLAGGIAHDFNNILTTVIGYSQIMALKLSEEDPMRDMAEEIFDAAERAAGLTRQLLAFSRKQVMEMKVVNLHTIVENISKMIGRLIGEDIDMRLITTESIGNIKADIGQLEQVIMNLAVNARDAMPNGGQLTIETGQVELDEKYSATHHNVEPGWFTVLTVTDTGKGMSPEIQEQIFQPFYSTKKLGQGTGLGLATVYGIVQQHNGHIYVYSEIEKGTTFKVYLPVVEENTHETYPKRNLTMPPGTETIMIVDDEAAIRRLVSDTLAPLGYNLYEAGSGEDALAIFRQTGKEIDLVLTDLIMPGMNGKELIETLSAARPGIKSILMSGYTDDIIARRGDIKPGDNFINKPLLPISLANKIREVLDSKQDNYSGFQVDLSHRFCCNPNVL